MSRLDAGQLAHAIRTAGSLVAQGALLIVDGVSMAHAVLDLAARVHELEAEHLVWVKRVHDAEDEAQRVRENS